MDVTSFTRVSFLCIVLFPMKTIFGMQNCIVHELELLNREQIEYRLEIGFGKWVTFGIRQNARNWHRNRTNKSGEVNLRKPSSNTLNYGRTRRENEKKGRDSGVGKKPKRSDDATLLFDGEVGQLAQRRLQAFVVGVLVHRPRLVVAERRRLDDFDQRRGRRRRSRHWRTVAARRRFSKQKEKAQSRWWGTSSIF